jgi:hypothetical protein
VGSTRQRARLGRAGPESQGGCGAGGATTGLPALAGRKGEKEGGNLKERVPIFSKHNQTLNSNEFEFKHPKMMHRHVCKKCFVPRKTQSLYIPLMKTSCC